MKSRVRSFRLVMIAAVFLLACLGPALAAAPPMARKDGRKAIKPEVGEHVPDFGFSGLDGRQYRLSDFHGHYVLLDFWATWCSICLEEEPTLRKAYERFHGRGLEIIGLDSDKQAAKALKYLGEHQIPWPQSAPASTKNVLDHVLEVEWYPAMVLLSPEGKILLVTGNGRSFLRGKKLLNTLDRLLPRGSSSTSAMPAASE